MRSFILTMLIVSNTVGGIEVAADFKEVWAALGALTFTAELQSHAADDASDLQEVADCDHCCHCGAHFTGFVGVMPSLTFARSTIRTPFSDIHYQIAGRAPPTPPPNV